jgi:hypothetical protein
MKRFWATSAAVALGVVVGITTVSWAPAAISWLRQPPPPSPKAQLMAEADCVKRGVRRYTSMGLYPSLDDGSAADVEIGRMCRVDAGAF